ncbi:hypothetical protein EV207_1516 [Scopulibacillus darangshiensis]|uniref:Uncharacterized protein n=1 Tax=Scopulibacillus darangshiensis TaxID=442528 RepID=A0A4R2NH62_9BACL|nr:hypothetical protein EV207_1516 [Scopulibacillus darangshiensis]
MPSCRILYIFLNLSENALVVGGIWAMIGFGYLLFLTRGFTKKPPQYDFNE